MKDKQDGKIQHFGAAGYKIMLICKNIFATPNFHCQDTTVGIEFDFTI